MYGPATTSDRTVDKIRAGSTARCGNRQDNAAPVHWKGARSLGKSKLVRDEVPATSCGGESWNACDAFCDRVYADLYPSSSCPHTTPSN